jgi:hypothetical protein
MTEATAEKTADVEITELAEIEPTRVDGVKSAANGFPILMIKSVQAGEGGAAASAVKDAPSYDESDDIDGATSVIADLADLIISEATELKAGRQEEAYDISLLMDAVCTMQQFLCREMSQDDGSAAEDGMTPLAQSIAEPAELVKGKYSAGEKRQMLREGKAIPNAKGQPSYPIGDKDDLGKAIDAVGRGNADHDAVRRHIIRAAKRLDATDMIPETWNSDGSIKAAPAKAVEPDTLEISNTPAAPSEPATQTATEKTVATVDPVDITEIVNRAVAKATGESAKALEAAQESAKALAAEVARLQNMPMPGGPMLLRPQELPSTRSTEVDRYKALAAKATDPSVRAAYHALIKAEQAD